MKRLYLSGLFFFSCAAAGNNRLNFFAGNALRKGFIEEPCYNLVYLELAACRLSTLPSDLATLAPNLRVLNLNYNFIEDAQWLEGLSRLKKLTLIGSRLKGTKAVVRILRGMPDVEMLDFRFVNHVVICVDC